MEWQNLFLQHSQSINNKTITKNSTNLGLNRKIVPYCQKRFDYKEIKIKTYLNFGVRS